MMVPGHAVKLSRLPQTTRLLWLHLHPSRLPPHPQRQLRLHHRLPRLAHLCCLNCQVELQLICSMMCSQECHFRHNRLVRSFTSASRSTADEMCNGCNLQQETRWVSFTTCCLFSVTHDISMQLRTQRAVKLPHR